MSIEIGTKLPTFQLKDQNDELFNSSENKSENGLVIYFYPKNFTPQCTKEACSFRDSFEDFSNAGIKVIGISADSEQSHKKFAAKFNLPFTLLADTDKKVRKLFEVENAMFGLLPGRETFVFDANGILISKFKAMNAQPHIDGALKLLKK
ncbi:peroxiredoxin [Patiriisocius marinus]|uniref:peroxiredoxin n=1 Tax=Patiriisocius marinus TaxID=1397112 RepID=UPI00232E0623|nr:peroxiredoxin [Patiriisocius marinus]